MLYYLNSRKKMQHSHNLSVERTTLMMKIVLAGGSGFLGRALLKELIQSGHTVTLLSRNPESTRRRIHDTVRVERWDTVTVGDWIQNVDGCDAVVNLAGESIASKRWTSRQKTNILDSRLHATSTLVSAIRQSKKKPAVFLSASAVGYYGNREEGEITEDSHAGTDFLAKVCDQWERAAKEAERFGVRTVLMRTGIVLDTHGGALPKLLFPFKFFVGGPLGSGGQWFPWIHLEDEVGAFVFALDQKNLDGPVNLAAPESVTMKQFCDALGRVLRRPSWAPVPAFILRAALGEMADALLLGGQKQVPKKLLEYGYAFRHPTLAGALADLLK